MIGIRVTETDEGHRGPHGPHLSPPVDHPPRPPQKADSLKGRATYGAPPGYWKLSPLGFAVGPFPLILPGLAKPLSALSKLTVPSPSWCPGLQGLRHSPEAAAQCVLPGWAIFLLGELRAWHCMLARRGLCAHQVRSGFPGGESSFEGHSQTPACFVAHVGHRPMLHSAHGHI